MKITILTVCLNSGSTLLRTIESVLQQSRPVDEYIIIDGGSVDSSIDIILSNEERFSGRLKWISEKDGGIYDAMNKGLALASGDVIGILNADDWYELNAIETIVGQCKEKPPGVWYGMLRKWDHDQERIIVREHHNFLGQDMIPHPASFVHKQIYRSSGVFDSSYALAADYELMLRFKEQKVPFYPVNDILANYQIGGASHKNSRRSWIETIKIRRKYQTISVTQYWIFRLLIEARVFAERFLVKEKIV